MTLQHDENVLTALRSLEVSRFGARLTPLFSSNDSDRLDRVDTDTRLDVVHCRPALWTYVSRGATPVHVQPYDTRLAPRYAFADLRVTARLTTRAALPATALCILHIIVRPRLHAPPDGPQFRLAAHGAPYVMAFTIVWGLSVLAMLVTSLVKGNMCPEVPLLCVRCVSAAPMLMDFVARDPSYVGFAPRLGTCTSSCSRARSRCSCSWACCTASRRGRMHWYVRSLSSELASVLTLLTDERFRQRRDCCERGRVSDSES